jgi:4-carboxymuconolactone decarboxylase
VSRLDPLDPQAMSLAQRRVHDDIVGGPRGAITGPFNAWLRSPAIADHAQKLGITMRFELGLPARVTELVTLLAARHYNCPYEWSLHAPIARQAGLAEATIQAVREGARPTVMAVDEAVAHDVAQSLYRTGDLGEDEYGRAIQNFGERGTVELVAAIGYAAMVSFTLNSFRVPPFGADVLDGHR